MSDSDSAGPLQRIVGPHAFITGRLGTHASFQSTSVCKGDPIYTKAEMDSALAAERERLCAAIKAADDESSNEGYMLDSNDCISVIRGTWGSAV